MRVGRRRTLAADVLRPALFATVILLLTRAAASGQTGADLAYTETIEDLCRQYAAAISGIPADTAFNQCMDERHCRILSGSSRYRCAMPGPMTWHGGGY